MPHTRQFKPAVILPTYNNAGTIADLLDGLAAHERPLIVVDDGCTDATPKILGQWAACHPDVCIGVISHRRNRGKAAAMRCGFDRAHELGCTHGLTIDTDGQHDPADVPALLEAAELHPQALVIGRRDAASPNCPRASLVGRSILNLSVFLATGRRIEDSLCGFRVYPLGLVRAVKCLGTRYAYEAEILTRAGWAGCPIVQAPVRTVYPPPGQRVSHVRPIRDTVIGWSLQFMLAIRAVTPWPFVKWPARQVRPARRQWWRRFISWVSPRELYRQLYRDKISRMSVAASLGIGTLVANLPVYPFQTILALYFAKRLHLHPLSTVAGSQLSTPPIGVILVMIAIGVGHILLTGSLPVTEDFHLTAMSAPEIRHVMRQYLMSWCIGAVIVGFILGWAVFGLSLLALRMMPMDRTASVLNDPAELERA